MKRLILLLSLTFSCLALLATSAEAKRFGGGASFGKQRSTLSNQSTKSTAAAPAPNATPNAAPNPQQNKNRWLGPLAGLAIGAGLGALFAGGMGGAFGGIIMAILAGVVVLFLLSFFRKRQQPVMQYAGAGSPNVTSPEYSNSGFTPAAFETQTTHIPADFPVEAFLRSAKTSFIRLQAANDRKDLDDIREYTTPEMFAEVSMQLQERGDAPQKTEVDSINAELLELAYEGDLAVASVRMSGQLRENNGAPDIFSEIWHVQKNLKDEKAVWLLSGIQQIA